MYTIPFRWSRFFFCVPLVLSSFWLDVQQNIGIHSKIRGRLQFHAIRLPLFFCCLCFSFIFKHSVFDISLHISYITATQRCPFRCFCLDIFCWLFSFSILLQQQMNRNARSLHVLQSYVRETNINLCHTMSATWGVISVQVHYQFPNSTHYNVWN